MARPYSIIADIKTKIRDLQKKKYEELETIAVKRQEANAEAEAAAEAVKNAAANMNIDAYEKAKAREAKARTAAEMYAAKYEQIRKQEFFSDQESEKVIADLLAHEEQLTEEFKKAIAEHNVQLSKLYTQYRGNILDTESIIDQWVSEIHKNYISDRATYGSRGNRSPEPVPVHSVPFYGCPESDYLAQYLLRAYME